MQQMLLAVELGIAAFLHTPYLPIVCSEPRTAYFTDNN